MTVRAAAAVSAVLLAWQARDVCARHVCVWRAVSALARGTWLGVALARPWSDWDDSLTGMAAVRVRQLRVHVSGHGSEAGSRALLWSVKMCTRRMGKKSAESRVA